MIQTININATITLNKGRETTPVVYYPIRPVTNPLKAIIELEKVIKEVRNETNNQRLQSNSRKSEKTN